jgi:hypothetical protein
MAMTLSGDGTIGGLVAGGLPDNSITTNDIAANAVSEGKLASNLYTCKAWVNFGGTGTVTLRASGNVTSITDNNVGQYTVNFTTAMPNTNYAFNFTCNGNGTDYRTFTAMLDGTKTVNSIRIILTDINAAGVDASEISASIFR